MTRTFGIEVECHLPLGGTHAGLASFLRDAGVAANAESYNHVTRRTWKVTTDASLEGRGRGYDTSAEVVSPVLSGEAGLIEARAAVQAIRDYGCTVSTKCGVHVHVGVADFSLDQLRALAIKFVHCETAFDAIQPPSRRANNNGYILSNRSGYGGSYENEGVNRAIDAYNRARNINELITTVSSCGGGSGGYSAPTRYRKLNLHAYLRQKTVEFRQHSGTVDPDKVENWVRLCVAFVERSLTAKPRKRPCQKPHTAHRELHWLLRYVGAGPSMRKFFTGRRRALARGDATAASPAAARAARAQG